MTMHNCALILIDIQKEYFEGGKSPLCRPEQAARSAGRVLSFFRDRGMPVLHIRHVNIKTGAAMFLPDSKGVEIHGSVAPLSSESVIVKHCPNAFLQTGLAEELKRLGATQLVVCGMMSHMCVDTTVRAAMDYGYAVTLLEDACATKDLNRNGQTLPAETVHQVFMAALHGMFAQVMTTDAFLADTSVLPPVH